MRPAVAYPFLVRRWRIRFMFSGSKPLSHLAHLSCPAAANPFRYPAAANPFRIQQRQTPSASSSGKPLPHPAAAHPFRIQQRGTPSMPSGREPFSCLAAANLLMCFTLLSFCRECVYSRGVGGLGARSAEILASRLINRVFRGLFS